MSDTPSETQFNSGSYHRDQSACIYQWGGRHSYHCHSWVHIYTLEKEEGEWALPKALEGKVPEGIRMLFDVSER